MITTDGGSAKLIDAFSGDVMGSIRATGAAKRVGQSCYTPDGSMIVNGDETGKVHVYDSKRGQLVSSYSNKIFGGWTIQDGTVNSLNLTLWKVFILLIF